MKRSKNPVTQFHPTVSKTPTAYTGTSPNEEPPAWRIARMEMVDPFGWYSLDATKLNAIREKLVEFERKTWNTILITEKHRNHSVSITNLCPEARKRLEDTNQDDIDEVVSLRLSGKERVWGIRIGFVMALLWWDPDHCVCPSLKSHT